MYNGQTFGSFDNQLGPLQSAAINRQGNQPNGGYFNVSPQFGSGVKIPGMGDHQTGGFSLGGFLDNNNANLQLGFGALSTLGGLWNSYNTNKLAKESFSLQKKAFETNLKNNTKTYNTALEDRIRARYATEGRSDEADAYIEEKSL